MEAQATRADSGVTTQPADDLGHSNGQSSPMLNWACATLSDTGHERAHNEDSLSLIPAIGLMILADGMGGYNAGEVASALAIEHAREYLSHELARCTSDARMVDAVQQAIVVANASILAAAARRPECLGMGTTMLVAAVSSRRITIGHVGDSRMYLLRNGKLARLTHDHSVGQAMIDSGALDEQAARLSSLRGVLTRALGVESVVDSDVTQIEWQNGDRLMLCSDGLTDMINDLEIASILGQSKGAEEVAKVLIQAALDAGGHDNVSVLLAFCNGSRES